jgi:hypothetical protein
MKAALISLFVMLLCLSAVRAQVQPQLAVSLKLMGFAWHPKPSEHPHLFVLRTGPHARSAFVRGAALSVEVGLYRNLLNLHIAQAWMADCAAMPAGFTHLGLKGILHSGPHSVGAGIGPTWFYRKSWTTLDGYTDEGLFRVKNGWQRSFYWYAGAMEYDYRFRPDMAVSLNLIPGWPEVFLLSAGVKGYVPEFDGGMGK